MPVAPLVLRVLGRARIVPRRNRIRVAEAAIRPVNDDLPTAGVADNLLRALFSICLGVMMRTRVTRAGLLHVPTTLRVRDYVSTRHDDLLTIRAAAVRTLARTR